jgi:iron complex outermembrane receptor protein
MNIASGISGNPYAANSIGGSIDLKLNKAKFGKEQWKTNVYTGYESNGNYGIAGVGLDYSSYRFYSSSSVFYRKSESYLAGGNQEVNFSQFEKLNLMSNFGFQFRKKRIVEGTIIYDVASNVGYPALTMDVSSAKGLITSLSYTQEELSDILTKWESKVYFNSIVHIMDDTKRPDVVMHMDMPGESQTAGFYSTLLGSKNRHSYLINFDSYYNRSLAEMTMYEEGYKDMFMYTWPDIRTANAGVYLEDKYRFDCNNSVHFSSKLAFQRDGVQSDFGLNTLRGFYPEMDQFQNRFLWNASGKYLFNAENLLIKAGVSYGFRAPSPTETYGFYLFNSFDNYDYLGNPFLKNESALENNFSFTYSKGEQKVGVEASYFYFSNYIIGKPEEAYSHMTLGASGVKAYTNLEHAQIFNAELFYRQPLLKSLNFTNKVTYSFGADDSSNPLPLIAPVSFTSQLNFNVKKFYADLVFNGAANQNRYSPEYGEDLTPAYGILSTSAGYELPIKKTTFSFKVGVENLLDSNYSTYSDWNNIPRKGRNIYFNININI